MFEGARGIVAQGHVTQLLRDHVRSGNVANAYIFSGIRGVGKTTAARVMAAALNCPDSRDGEPCAACDSCASIVEGRQTLDVCEVDAASNRGVSDTKELLSRVSYSPSGEDRWKVYIIDEAHMLTKESWNAMLKILEEPPARVVFVFATTELSKIGSVAPPILSRSQKFAFRKIGESDIQAQLRQVVDAEKIEAEDDALRLLASRAKGSMRDALTDLGQIQSFFRVRGNRLSAATVRAAFNLPDEDVVLAAIDMLASAGRDEKGPTNTRRRAFTAVDWCAQNALDHADFFGGVRDALEAAFRLKVGARTSGWSASSATKLGKLKDQFSFDELASCLTLAQAAAKDLREPGTSETPEAVLTVFLLNAIQALEARRKPASA